MAILSHSPKEQTGGLVPLDPPVTLYVFGVQVTVASNPWLVLACAIILEVAGTTFLKLSDGFRNLGAAAVMGLFYAASFYCVSLVIKHLSVGMAYAVWAGVGTILVALVGHLVLGDRLTPMQAVFIVIVAVGVAGLKISSPA